MISIVIPAFNEATRIGAQLDALAHEPGIEDCEILVADNGSTDETVDTVKRWAARLPVRIVDASARRGQAYARNLAVRCSVGELLLFIDADDAVMPGWLLAWQCLGAEVEFASGPVIWFRADEAPPRTCERAPRRLPTHMGFLPYALGANFAVRRDLFTRSGGFDETYPPAEDVELSWRLQLMGATLVFVPSAVVAKREAATVQSTIRQYFHYGVRDPFLYRDFRGRGAKRRAVVPTSKTYIGLLGRVPLLWMTEQRKRWAQQLGKCAGHIIGSQRAKTLYL